MSSLQNPGTGKPISSESAPPSPSEKSLLRMLDDLERQIAAYRKRLQKKPLRRG